MTIKQQIEHVKGCRSHVLLLGAGSSYAALPNGDLFGRPVPLLRDVAKELKLADYFPEDLRDLAETDFETAYSKLHIRDATDSIANIDWGIFSYFSTLELPEEPNLYDVMNLSLRAKDVIATFNWDPFLVQSQVRLTEKGLGRRLPKPKFLHGNVLAAYCEQHQSIALTGAFCPECDQPMLRSRLLFPIEQKDYQSDWFTRLQWDHVRAKLGSCAMFTVFGYSAPKTDREAIDLFSESWGRAERRELEQIEIINHPDADKHELWSAWKDFICEHHYSILGAYRNSFLGLYPRRSIECWWNQFEEMQRIEPNPVPQDFRTLDELIDWYQPLFEAEDKVL